MDFVVFFFLAVLLIAAALGVVLNRNPVRSAMCLVATLFLLAIFFILLHADFVAALQIVVYAGAIMVLFLFVIMLLNLQDEAHERRPPAWQIATLISGSLFALLLVYLLREAGLFAPTEGSALPGGFGTTQMIALRLFTHFLLPFEITGVLMLAAVIGAVVLARKKVA